MNNEVIVHNNPKSPVSEVFRTLRTNLQFMSTSKGLKTLLITSTLQEEGKSWISANLAVTFAQAGKKVILVDVDMRKGRQYKIFDVPSKPGLSNYLSGIDEKEDITEYIKETEVENLYVIPAGNVPPNPAELLSSARMSEMLQMLKQECDIVILDGPPALLVTDATVVSRYVDSTLIVSKYKSTKMDDLKKVTKDIQNVGGKIAGIVINKIPVSQKNYENTYYYGSSEKDSGKNKEKDNKVKKKEETKIEVTEEVEKIEEKIAKEEKQEQAPKKEKSAYSEELKKTDEILEQMNAFWEEKEDKIDTKEEEND